MERARRWVDRQVDLGNYWLALGGVCLWGAIMEIAAGHFSGTIYALVGMVACLGALVERRRALLFRGPSRPRRDQRTNVLALADVLDVGAPIIRPDDEALGDSMEFCAQRLRRLVERS